MSLESLRACPQTQALRDRAKCLCLAREFFKERQILEVDTPVLASTAPVDEHIDVFQVLLPEGKFGYLHTSPEYAMKRLIAQGIGDIYQLSHVFREGEIGDRHNPEFTMAEWYRMAMNYETFIEETLEFLRLFLGPSLRNTSPTAMPFASSQTSIISMQRKTIF